MENCCGAHMDRQHLFYASNSTSIDGTMFPGSVGVESATGGIRWETGLGGSIEGSPSINSSGVIAAAAFSGPAGGARGTLSWTAQTARSGVPAHDGAGALPAGLRRKRLAARQWGSPTGLHPPHKGTRHLRPNPAPSAPNGRPINPRRMFAGTPETRTSASRIPDLSKRHDDRHGSGRHDDLC